MTRVDTASFISVTEANQLGVSALIRDAEQGNERVVLRNNRPVAVVMGFDQFEREQQQMEDLEDIALTAARVLTASPERTSLDDVLNRFGYTREELKAFLDEQE